MMTAHSELTNTEIAPAKLAHGELAIDQVGRSASPALLPGVQLVQTAADVVHLVGDIDNPVSLFGASSDCVRWLTQVDGRISRDAQLWHAEALGVSPELAESVLVQLETQGLVVDAARTTAAIGFGQAHIFGHEVVAVKLRDLVPTLRTRGDIPSPRRNPDWRYEAEEIADGIGPYPAVVVLAQPRPSSAEVDFVTKLVGAQVPHLVVAAGMQTARVGPYTAAQGGPCLRCDSLAHSDTDQVWRHIGAQLSLDELPTDGPSVLMATLAAAEAARQMAAVVAGDFTAAENAVMQSGYRGGAWRRRLMVRHQQCSCWWPQSLDES
jgi:hypothetical protein